MNIEFSVFVYHLVPPSIFLMYQNFIYASYYICSLVYTYVHKYCFVRLESAIVLYIIITWLLLNQIYSIILYRIRYSMSTVLLLSVQYNCSYCQHCIHMSFIQNCLSMCNVYLYIYNIISNVIVFLLISKTLLTSLLCLYLYCRDIIRKRSTAKEQTGVQR